MMVLAAGLGGLELVLGVIAAILGLAGGAGITYAYFTAAKGKAVQELYQAEAAAQKARGDRLDREAIEMKTRLSACESAQSVLAEQVSGRREVLALRDELHTQHVEMMELLTRLLYNLADHFAGPKGGSDARPD